MWHLVFHATTSTGAKEGGGREGGGHLEGGGEKRMGGYRRVRMGKGVQRATPYILFYPLDMTRIYESFGII